MSEKDPLSFNLGDGSYLDNDQLFSLLWEAKEAGQSLQRKLKGIEESLTTEKEKVSSLSSRLEMSLQLASSWKIKFKEACKLVHGLSQQLADLEQNDLELPTSVADQRPSITLSLNKDVFNHANGDPALAAELQGAERNASQRKAGAVRKEGLQPSVRSPVAERSDSPTKEASKRLTEALQTEVRKLQQQLEEKEEEIGELEDLVIELRRSLVEEKKRSADEAEDLTQEMAELRFELTERLEEEKRRRAETEDDSVRRVQELESTLAESEKRVAELLAEQASVLGSMEAREASVRVKERQLASVAEDLRRKAAAMRTQLGQAEARGKTAEERARRAEEMLRGLGVQVPLADTSE